MRIPLILFTLGLLSFNAWAVEPPSTVLSPRGTIPPPLQQLHEQEKSSRPTTTKRESGRTGTKKKQLSVIATFL